MINKLILLSSIFISGCNLFHGNKPIVPIQIEKVDNLYILDYCKEPITPKLYFNITKDSNIDIKNLLIYINYLYNNNKLCYTTISQYIIMDNVK